MQSTTKPAAERGDGGVVAGERVGRAGGADRHRRAGGGVGTTTWNARAPSRPRASSARCDVDRPALRLGQHDARLAGLDSAQGEHVGEVVDPLPSIRSVSMASSFPA